MRLRYLVFCLPALLGLGGPAHGEKGKDPGEAFLAGSGWKPHVYKTTPQAELRLWVKVPKAHSGAEGQERPAIVFFYGGGWKGGTIRHFEKQGTHLAERGMVAILADYRQEQRYGGTPFDCVEDAKSAMRWVRGQAGKLGIDPDRLAAGGGSAGGHLAVATATLRAFDAETDDLSVSPVPNALVLFNPVYDNGPEGYGFERVKERWKEFSPMHNLRQGLPPMIVFLGDQDALIPVSTAKRFDELVEEAGGRCETHIYEGRPHGFFNRGEDFDDTLAKADAFLTELGYLPAP